jgi:hypothetical protein
VIIEQRAELNRLVDPSIPLTWEWRRRQLEMLLPVWCFILACIFEMALLRDLVTRKPTVSYAPIFAACAFLLFFLLGMCEIEARMRHRSKRVIQLKERAIIVRPACHQFIRWKDVARFQLEPVPEMPGITKLKLYLARKKPPAAISQPVWSMALEQPQKQELLRLLQARKAEGPVGYQVECLEQPKLETKPKPFPAFGLWVNMTGGYLLLHGVVLLPVALKKNPQSADRGSMFNSEMSEKIGRFVARHFSSEAEWHHFLLIFAVALIVAGAALYVLSLRMANSGRRSEVDRAGSSS